MPARVSMIALTVALAGLASALPNYGYADPVATSSIADPAYTSAAVPVYGDYGASPVAPVYTASGTEMPAYPIGTGVPSCSGYECEGADYTEVISSTYIATMTTKVPCDPYVTGTETLSYTSSKILTIATNYQTITYHNAPTGVPSSTYPHGHGKDPKTIYEDAYTTIYEDVYENAPSATDVVPSHGHPAADSSHGHPAAVPKETVYVTIPAQTVTVTESASCGEATPAAGAHGHGHPSGYPTKPTGHGHATSSAPVKNSPKPTGSHGSPANPAGDYEEDPEVELIPKPTGSYGSPIGEPTDSYGSPAVKPVEEEDDCTSTVTVAVPRPTDAYATPAGSTYVDASPTGAYGTPAAYVPDASPTDAYGTPAAYVPAASPTDAYGTPASYVPAASPTPLVGSYRA